MASSGTTAYAIAVRDIGLECFERLGILAPQLQTEHHRSLNRSLNLVLSRWSNLGVNLWRVSDTIGVTLVQGTATYGVDPDVISILPEATIRTFPMNAPISQGPDFDTALGSSLVTVRIGNHGLSVGGYVGIIIPCAVGGLLLQAYYAAVSVVDEDTFVIDAIDDATSSASGGVVPQYQANSGSAAIVVNLANHGMLAGQSWQIHVQVQVGGITLPAGAYPVTAVLNADSFYFTASSQASSTESVYENDGMTQFALQQTDGLPVDRVIYPLSRADYDSIPTKAQQGSPTSFYFNRQLSPTFNLWPVPDQNGPYEFRYETLQQVEDMYATGNQTPNLPYRFFEAFCAAVSAHLAWKWAPDRQANLQGYAEQMWKEASDADRERVSFYATPNFSSYMG